MWGRTANHMCWFVWQKNEEDKHSYLGLVVHFFQQGPFYSKECRLVENKIDMKTSLCYKFFTVRPALFTRVQVDWGYKLDKKYICLGLCCTVLSTGCTRFLRVQASWKKKHSDIHGAKLNSEKLTFWIISLWLSIYLLLYLCVWLYALHKARLV